MPPIAVDTGSSLRYIGTVVSPSWFTDAISPDGDPDNGCHPQEAQALRDYHEGKITVQEAAYGISRPTATSQSTELNCERNKLWNLLIAALEEWPRTRKLSDIRPPQGDGESPRTCHQGRGKAFDHKRSLLERITRFWEHVGGRFSMGGMET